MKKFLLTSVAVAALSTSALAADLPARTYTKAPPMAAPLASWSGFYLGGSIGGRWADVDTRNVLVAPGPGPLFAASAAGTYDSSTVRAGGYVGYNWQFSPNMLLGIEGDFAYGDGSAGLSTIPGLVAPGAVGTSSSVQHGWEAGVRGRLGFLVTPAVLLYVNGGATWLDVEANANVAGLVSQTNSSTRSGWTVGAGLETMIWNNWLARVEYRYADYGVWRTNFFGAGTGVAQTTVDVDVRTHTALFGLAYKF
jgi:outer membrane immunogenic protein